jgi:hypothetical protein
MTSIYVPSKNRSQTSALLKLAKTFNISLAIVVEPQEFEIYQKAYPEHQVISLPEDNRGITYVRNFIKTHAESYQLKSYWQLDDDISGFFTREGTKLIKSDFSVLDEAQMYFQDHKIALGALEYRQFAWSATKDVILNSFCDVCVYVDLELTRGIKYREYVEGKEDRDFAMQVVKSRNKTGRYTKAAFSAPANGTNEGGLKEIFYDLGKEEICVDRMVEYWGENICVPITKPNGRKDIKIKWNLINSAQTSLF